MMIYHLFSYFKMTDLLAFIFLNFLAAVSPGPDFAIVVRFGLTGSRKAAMQAALGITLALFFHVFYCMSGVALILQKNPTFLLILKVLGSFYLGYLGIKMLSQKVSDETDTQKTTILRNPFVAGLSTNLLNPKVTFFCISLFTQFAGSYNTLPMKVAFALSAPLAAIIWYSLVSYFFTNQRFMPFLQKQKASFIKVMGVILIALSFTSVII